jgi:hypothetical protein
VAEAVRRGAAVVDRRDRLGPPHRLRQERAGQPLQKRQEARFVERVACTDADDPAAVLHRQQQGDDFVIRKFEADALPPPVAGALLRLGCLEPARAEHAVRFHPCLLRRRDSRIRQPLGCPTGAAAGIDNQIGGYRPWVAARALNHHPDHTLRAVAAHHEPRHARAISECHIGRLLETFSNRGLDQLAAGEQRLDPTVLAGPPALAAQGREITARVERQGAVVAEARRKAGEQAL